MLKVSISILKNKKSFIPKIFFLKPHRTAKIVPKDGVSRLNFPEDFSADCNFEPQVCINQAFISKVLQEKMSLEDTQELEKGNTYCENP